MRLHVRIARPQHPGTWTARVSDPAFPGETITLTFQIVQRQRERHPSMLRLVELQVSRKGRGTPVRHDPVIGLERRARDAELVARRRLAKVLEKAKPYPIRDIVRSRYPEVLKPSTKKSKGAARSMKAHLRLAARAQEYLANLQAGLPDPSAELARRHGVPRERARAWVHRARRAGYLGPTNERRAG
jgi:hypothetical protein